MFNFDVTNKSSLGEIYAILQRTQFSWNILFIHADEQLFPNAHKTFMKL